MPTIDASTPARALESGGGTLTNSATTASFSPPANSWLYCHFLANPSGTGNTITFNTPTNSGTALSWSQVVTVSNNTNPHGGSIGVYRAFNINAQAGITVTATASFTNSNGAANAYVWVDVWTGCAASQTGAATNTGTSTAKTINTPSVTTTASGSRVVEAVFDWSASGAAAPTSSDTIDGYWITGESAGGRIYKASDTGSPQAVTCNYVADGAATDACMVIYEILGSATGPTITSQPTNQTVYAGQNATFNITATGTGTVHYQWKFNGSNVGSDQNSYTRTTVIGDNGGTVQCVVTDDNGSTNSNTVTLTVLGTAIFAWGRA
jgi:hypothetical protein